MMYEVHNNYSDDGIPSVAHVLRDGIYKVPKHVQKAIELTSDHEVFGDFGYKVID